MEVKQIIYVYEFELYSKFFTKIILQYLYFKIINIA